MIISLPSSPSPTPPSLQELVTIASNMDFQSKKVERPHGRQKISVEVLVAASLRHLGKGHDFVDTIHKECFVSGCLLLKFHHAFMAELGGKHSAYYTQWVSWPDEESEEFQGGLDVYARLGFPGCLASVDGTHIPWENAPNAVQSWYRGKEKIKTIMYNCSVAHDGKLVPPCTMLVPFRPQACTVTRQARTVTHQARTVTKPALPP